MRLADKAFGTRKPVFLAVPRIVPKLTLFGTVREIMNYSRGL